MPDSSLVEMQIVLQAETPVYSMVDDYKTIPVYCADIPLCVQFPYVILKESEDFFLNEIIFSDLVPRYYVMGQIMNDILQKRIFEDAYFGPKFVPNVLYELCSYEKIEEESHTSVFFEKKFDKFDSNRILQDDLNFTLEDSDLMEFEWNTQGFIDLN